MGCLSLLYIVEMYIMTSVYNREAQIIRILIERKNINSLNLYPLLPPFPTPSPSLHSCLPLWPLSIPVHFAACFDFAKHQFDISPLVEVTGNSIRGRNILEGKLKKKKKPYTNCHFEKRDESWDAAGDKPRQSISCSAKSLAEY